MIREVHRTGGERNDEGQETTDQKKAEIQRKAPMVL